MRSHRIIKTMIKNTNACLTLNMCKADYTTKRTGSIKNRYKFQMATVPILIITWSSETRNLLHIGMEIAASERKRSMGLASMRVFKNTRTMKFLCELPNMLYVIKCMVLQCTGCLLYTSRCV